MILPVCLSLIFALGLPLRASAQGVLKKKVDSLFVIASAGEVKYQQVKKVAEDSLVAMGPQITPFLIDKFDTKEARERLAITDILKRVGPPAVPYLLPVLKNENGVVVERVANALGEIKDTAATLALLGVAEHPRWQVRDNAIGALGKIGDQRGDSAVVRALSDSINLVRKSAAVSAGQLKVTPAIRALVHLFGDVFYGARLSAAASVIQMDTTLVAPAVIDSLQSPNMLVGNVGCAVLGQLATPAALEALVNQTKAADPDRRAHAAIALVKADPEDKLGSRKAYLANETDRLARLKVESAIVSLGHGKSQSQ